jgi:very-short-patch-repair endonuclease
MNDDAERQEYLESFSIEFLRFKNEEVYQDLDGMIDKIEERVKQLKQKLNK